MANWARRNLSFRQRRSAGGAFRAFASAVLAALATGLALSPAAGAAPALAADAPRLLVVLQTVGSSAAGLPMTIEVRLGTPAGLGGAAGATLALPATHLAAASVGIEGVAAGDYGSGVTAASAIETLAAARLQAQAASLGAQLEHAMQATGAQGAIFTLLQQVTPAPLAGAAAPAAATLAWTHVRLAGQREHSSAPRLRPDAPQLLLVRYTPLRSAPELPAGTHWPQPGELEWVPVDAALQPAGSASALPTAGAFDEPPAMAGAAVDPDAGLHCLLDHLRKGCDPGLPDVASLMASSGASGAMLEYRRRLALQRRAVSLAGGTTAWEAVLATRIDRRTLGPLGPCGASGDTYRNLGRRGYVVQATADRFLLAAADPTHARPLGSTTDSALVPSETYDKQVALPRTTAAALDGIVIDPAGDLLDLLPAATVPGLQGVAPIEVLAAGPPARSRNSLPTPFSCTGPAAPAP